MQEKYIESALSLGFTYAVALSGLELICEPDIRAFCNPKGCQNYGLTWVCPPGCGEIEECQTLVSRYKSGIVLQTVAELPEDMLDRWDVLYQLQKEHNSRLLTLADSARSAGLEVLPLTTGGCIVCKKCTFPDDACREPNRRMHSLSAYGIDVGKLCKIAGLEYSFRSDKVYYTACLMMNE